MGKVAIISGPSGCGKTTICQELLKNPGVRKSISVTTRPRRPEEKEGINYYFVTEEEFIKKIKEGKFAEYARYAGHLYGTLLEPLEKALEEDIIYLLEIDVQGARQIMERFSQALSIFILPPPEEVVLERRLLGRKGQAPLIEKVRELIDFSSHDRVYNLSTLVQIFQEPYDKVIEALWALRDAGYEIHRHRYKLVNGSYNIPEERRIFKDPEELREEVTKGQVFKVLSPKVMEKRRLEIAKDELKEASRYRYCVVNDKLERAVEEVRKILGLNLNEHR